MAGTPVVDGIEIPGVGVEDADGRGKAAYYWIAMATAASGAGALAYSTERRRRHKKRDEEAELADWFFDELEPDPTNESEDDDLYLRLAAQDRLDEVATQPAADAYWARSGDQADDERLDSRSPATTMVSVPAKPRVVKVEPVMKPTATAVKPSRKKRSPLFGWAGVLLLLSAAGWFGVQGFRASTEPQVSPVALSSPRLHTTPIEQITVGHRVLGENPELTPADRAAFGPEPDPATWRKLELRAPKTDGSWADVTLLRGPDWLAEHQPTIGGTIPISVPECGIEGNAEVLSIGLCPTIKSGSGHVVTGSFRHHSAQVLDLHVEGLAEPIGTTTNHPFWSEDRQQFVRADELRRGERLRTFDDVARVASLVPRSAPEPVYNLEVQGEHVYRVGASGVLAHNGILTGWCSKPRLYGGPIADVGVTVNYRLTGDLADMRVSMLAQPKSKFQLPRVVRALEKEARAAGARELRITAVTVRRSAFPGETLGGVNWAGENYAAALDA